MDLGGNLGNARKKKKKYRRCSLRVYIFRQKSAPFIARFPATHVLSVQMSSMSVAKYFVDPASLPSPIGKLKSITNLFKEVMRKAEFQMRSRLGQSMMLWSLKPARTWHGSWSTFHPLNSQNLTLWAVREGNLIDVIDFMTSGTARHLRQIRHLRHHQTVLWLGQRGLGRLEIKLLFENISKLKSMLKAGCLCLVLIIPMWNTEFSVVDIWLVLAWIISNGYSIFGNTSNFDRPAQRWLWLQCVLWPPPPPPYSVFSFKFGNLEF